MIESASRRLRVIPVPVWGLARVVGVLLTVLLLVGLVVRSELALNLLWNAAVPLLPAVVLLSPPVRRNVCPLATLNTFTGNRMASRGEKGSSLTTGGTVLTGAVGIGLLLLLGLRRPSKAGFCNAICPVLPVERLYGQYPLLRVSNARCRPCILCTESGCLDRTPGTALVDTIEPAGGTGHWIPTPFGSLALAFPGFVFGYYRWVDGGVEQIATVFGSILGWMVISLAIGVLLSLLGVKRRGLLRGAAALAIGIYYWYGAPTGQAAWALPELFVPGVRAAAVLLIGYWLARSLPVPLRPEEKGR